MKKSVNEKEYSKIGLKDPYGALKRLEKKLGFEITNSLNFNKNEDYQLNDRYEPNSNVGGYVLAVDYRPPEGFLYVYICELELIDDEPILEPEKEEEAESETIEEEVQIEPMGEDETKILIWSPIDVTRLVKAFSRVDITPLIINYTTSKLLVMDSLLFDNYDTVFVEANEEVVEILPLIKGSFKTPLIAICNNWDTGIEAKKNGVKDFIFAPLDPPDPTKLTEIIKQIKGAKGF